MNDQKTEEQLREILQMLEKTFEKVIETSGYVQGAKELKLLSELVKEQIIDENTMHSASSTR